MMKSALQPSPYLKERGPMSDPREATETTGFRYSDESLSSGISTEHPLPPEITVLHRVRSAISHHRELDDIYRVVVEEIAAAFGYTHVSIYTLIDGQTLV